MSHRQKVSVILTSYNHDKYLRESIESVLNQTYPDFDLIIWDDGSSDNSWNIIKEYSDPRIRAFRNTTYQRGSPILSVFSEVETNEYMAIQHSDDIWEPDKLAKQLNFLADNPRIGAVFSWAQIIDENGYAFQDQDHFYFKIFEQPNRSRFEWLNFFFYKGNALCHPSVLIRKRCFEDCGSYRYGLPQTGDFDMWVRLCLKYDIHVIPERLVRFRVRAAEANASGNRPEVRVRSHFEFLKIYENYRTIQDKEEFLKVFPNTAQYFISKDYDIQFALGMAALEPETYNSAKLFGLSLLFDVLNEPEKARKIKTLYGFDMSGFIKLTARYDVFSIEQTRRDQKIAVLYSEIENLQESMSAVLKSTSWRITKPLRWVGSQIIQFKNRLTNTKKRFFQAIERYGLPIAIVRGSRLLFIYLVHKLNRLLHLPEYYRKLSELDKIVGQHDGFFDIFHVPMGWHTPLFQRFQQISLQVHKLGGLAFYGGHPLVDHDILVFEKATDNLYIFEATDRRVARCLFNALEKKNHLRMIRIQSIDLLTTIEEIRTFISKGFTVVYEYIDEITSEITGSVPGFVYERHEQLLRDTRVIVVATSDQLLAQVMQFRSDNYILSTNGVDVEFWRQERDEPPPDLTPALNDNIIVGYHGALAKWIDYDLLRMIANNGAYELVLIGHEHDQAFRDSGLMEHPKVHYLGSKTYFELPSYVPYYDVAILPFIKNKITDSVSPVKIFEYMAALKPIVSTDLSECRKYRSCLIAKTGEDFMMQLEKAASLRFDPAYISVLSTEAENNSWVTKIKDVIKLAGYDA